MTNTFLALLPEEQVKEKTEKKKGKGQEILESQFGTTINIYFQLQRQRNIGRPEIFAQTNARQPHLHNSALR